MSLGTITPIPPLPGGWDGTRGQAQPHCPHPGHEMAEVRPKALPGDCRAISYGVITSSMFNEVKPLPGISEFLITYSLIAALKYININD